MEGSVSEEPKSVQSEIDASRARKIQRCKTIQRINKTIKSHHLRLGKTALKFYEKSQDAEFEMVEVLYAHCSDLTLPGSKSSEVWGHVSFIAKPKNADCSDVSPKYFFAELCRDDLSGKFNATYCSTFEPIDDPAFNHGCILCSPGEKFHPADGYRVGCTPWQKAKFNWISAFGRPPNLK